MDRTFSPSRVEKTIQQFKRNRRENRWDGGRRLTKRVWATAEDSFWGKLGSKSGRLFSPLMC